MYIRLRDLRVIERLWRELAEFPPDASDQALEHCFRELARLVGAANVFWVGGLREQPAQANDPVNDPLRGWRVRAVRHLYRDERLERLLADHLRHVRLRLPDPHTEAMAATAGATRAFLRQEIVDDRAWERSWQTNEVLRPLGIADRLVGAHTVNAANESYLGLDRGRGRPFGERERDLLRLFLAGAPRFHRDALRAHGLIGCAAPLTSREQQILQLLLTDLSEKQIASEMSIGWRTAHQHAVSIFRKLGVKGRTGLMALWVGAETAPKPGKSPAAAAIP
jgi:DNA-binding CsgD family transcriptional regulator